MSVAHVDDKGRLVLGRKFAGKTVLLREVDESTIEVTMARVISEHEAWLLNNPEARKSVARGLGQARKGQFAAAPDVDADSDLAKKLADEAMFTVRWTLEARAQYDALRKRAEASLAARRKSSRTKATADEGLFKQTLKCSLLLAENPRHPGLHTHPYYGLEHPFEKGGKVFEAYVQNRTPAAYRLFWCYGPGKKELTIISITAHP